MSDKKAFKTAPDFTAADTAGRNIKLSDFRGRKNVMVIFNRGFQ